ncbi:MAG: hypothetical protein P9X22_05230 [Candidatus Zapsychrus exili]|nr:hypothetical protein [Candidatus Zapsychrus exili]
MRLVRLLKVIGVITMLALVYTHMQMKITDLAYRGKDKEKQIRKLIEENGNVTYNILTLKSANNLGIKMLSEDSDMHFVDPEDIVRIPTLKEFRSKNKSKKRPELVQRANAFLNLLSLNSKKSSKRK